MTIPILKLLTRRPRSRKPMDWQVIFELARVNGAENYQEYLPVHGRDWPKETWLQTRTEQVRKEMR